MRLNRAGTAAITSKNLDLELRMQKLDGEYESYTRPEAFYDHHHHYNFSNPACRLER